LLSALIFPGIGQLFLRKYASAMVIGGAAFAGFYFLVEEFSHSLDPERTSLM